MFFFNDTATTEIYTLSLHDALPICGRTTERIVEATVTGDLGEYGIKSPWATNGVGVAIGLTQRRDHLEFAPDAASEDRKSTRLNSSHANISYAVFCLKKKKIKGHNY